VVPAIRLDGLDLQATYSVTDLNGRTVERSGSYLANHGIDVTLIGDYASTLFVLTRK